MSRSFPKIAFLVMSAFSLLLLLTTIAAGQTNVFSPGDVQRVVKSRESTLFRVNVTRENAEENTGDGITPPENGESLGTAVFLFRESLSSGDFGYFVTCFHVLYKSTRFELTDHTSNNVIAQANPDDPGSALLYSAPTSDLIIIRTPLKSGFAGSPLLKTLTRNGPSNTPSIGEHLAIGFPFYNTTTFHDAIVRVGRDHGISVVPKLQARPLLGDPTAPGTSGGLVLGYPDKFAGLILGRMTDIAGIMLPASKVVEELKKAMYRAKANRLQPFKPAKVKSWEKPPYSRPELKKLFMFHEGSQGVVDIEKWDLMSHWNQLLLGSSRFRTRFQEITIDLSHMLGSPVSKKQNHKQDEPIELHLDPYSRPDALADAELWINTTKVNVEESQPIQLNEHLRPGENLIVIRRKTRKRQSFNRLKDLFARVRLDAKLSVGGQTMYSIQRELPAIFDAFTLFITIEMNQQTPAPRGNMVVMLDTRAVTTLLNRTRLSVTETMGKASEPFSARLVINPKQAKLDISMIRRTAQTMGFTVTTRTRLEDIRVQFGGLALKNSAGQPGIALPETGVSIHGELQIVEANGGPRITARITDVELDGANFTLPNGWILDIAYPLGAIVATRLQHGFRDTFLDTRSNRPAKQSILSLIPGLVQPGSQVRIVNARFTGHGWLMLTMSVGGKGSQTGLCPRDVATQATGTLYIETCGIPNAQLQQLLGGFMSAADFKRYRSTARLMERARLVWKPDLKTLSLKKHAISSSNVDEWWQDLLRGVRSQSTLRIDTDVSAMLDAAKPWFKKVRMGKHSGTGGITMQIDKNAIEWRNRGKVEHRFSELRIDNTKFENVRVLLDSLKLTGPRKQYRLTGSAQGTVRIARVPLKPVHGIDTWLTDVELEHQTKVDKNNPRRLFIHLHKIKARAHARLEPLEASVKVRGKRKWQKLTVENDCISGDLSLVASGWDITLKLLCGRVEFNVDLEKSAQSALNGMLDEASRLLKKSRQEAEKVVDKGMKAVDEGVGKSKETVDKVLEESRKAVDEGADKLKKLWKDIR